MTFNWVTKKKTVPWTIILMLVSSLPKAFVATHVNNAESPRSVLLILKSERTPLGKISSLMVYLLSADLGSRRLLLMFQRMPIGFSPRASHCNTAGSPRRAV